MAQASECSKAQKAKVQRTYAEMASKFGRTAANAAISAYNAALDGLKALLQAEKTVLTPLASLDDLFIESFVKFPLNTVSNTVDSAMGSLIIPLHTIGIIGGQCSDSKKAAETATKKIDDWRKYIDDKKRSADKLDLIKGSEVLKNIDNSIDWLTDWKIDPIP